MSNLLLVLMMTLTLVCTLLQGRATDHRSPTMTSWFCCITRSRPSTSGPWRTIRIPTGSPCCHLTADDRRRQGRDRWWQRGSRYLDWSTGVGYLGVCGPRNVCQVMALRSRASW